MQQDEQTAQDIRQTVLKRMKALATPDLKTAGEIVADDFQLIPPNGAPLTKAQYFASIETGAIRYRVWEAASPIAVRLYGDVAAIRYQAEIVVETATVTRKGRYWFSDLYEKRQGRWQIVWSQGTFVAA